MSHLPERFHSQIKCDMDKNYYFDTKLVFSREITSRSIVVEISEGRTNCSKSNL